MPKIQNIPAPIEPPDYPKPDFKAIGDRAAQGTMTYQDFRDMRGYAQTLQRKANTLCKSVLDCTSDAVMDFDNGVLIDSSRKEMREAATELKKLL
jgi:hypothetical protein